MITFFWTVAVFLLLNAVLCLYRAYAGPEVADRVLAVNIIVTKTLVILAILAAILGRGMLFDVALVYGLLNFVLAIAASRFLESGRLGDGNR